MLYFHIFEPTNPKTCRFFSDGGLHWMKNKIRSRCPPRWVRDVVFAPRKYELHVDVGNGVDPLSTLEQMSEKGFAGEA